MTGMVKYDAACRAIAECKAVDEVKGWADKAAAMQAYGRMAKDSTLEIDAAEIRIRAERRLGELLAEQKATGGLNRGSAGKIQEHVAGPRQSRGPAEDVAETPRASRPVTEEGEGTGGRQSRPPVPTLADAGISKDLSSRAQKLAAVPEAEFEREVGDWRERVSEEGARVTARLEQAGERAIRKAAPAPAPAVSDPGEVEALRTQVSELQDRIAELGEMAEELREDRDSMARVFEANDQVAAALAEAKRYREQVRILEARVRGQASECAQAKQAAKTWKAKYDKLERARASVAA